MTDQFLWNYPSLGQGFLNEHQQIIQLLRLAGDMQLTFTLYSQCAFVMSAGFVHAILMLLFWEIMQVFLDELRTPSLTEKNLVDVSDIFHFSDRGKGRGSPKRQEGRGSVFHWKIPAGEGGLLSGPNRAMQPRCAMRFESHTPKSLAMRKVFSLAMRKLISFDLKSRGRCQKKPLWKSCDVGLRCEKSGCFFKIERCEMPAIRTPAAVWPAMRAPAMPNR